MKKIPVPTSELIGTFLEAIGYGVFLVVLPQCLRIMLRRNLGRVLTSIFVTSIVVNFLLITLHLVVDLTRAFVAFTANMDVAGAAEAYYANVDTHLNITKNAAYCSATLLGDALLLYRTWIVWGRNVWIMILPVLLFFLDFAMSVWFTWSVNEAHAGSSVLVSSVFLRSKYFLVSTLALNLLCTILIAFKIWRIQSKVTGYVSPSRGANALSIILESAAMYSAALVFLIATSITGSSVFFWFLNSMPPLIGSVFSYIILRSSTDVKRFNNEPGTVDSSSGVNNNTIASRGYRHQTANFTRTNQSEVEGVHVHLQQIVHHDENYQGMKASDLKSELSV